jgi:branched-chain amino acid transport system ATP-binding protein
MLEIEHVNAGYGAVQILFDISLRVEKGTIVSLLGKNGAGKTTLMRTVIGLLQPFAGRVSFGGRSISGESPDRIARSGIGYVPEDRGIFPRLTVEENLRVTRPCEGRRRDLAEIYANFPILVERARQLGGTLSGGEQQLLSIARALMGSPSLLLLDEPSEGLAPLIIEALAAQVNKLKQSGLTILLAEQNLGFCRRVSDFVYIIDKGEVHYGGSFADIDRNPTLVREHLFAREAGISVPVYAKTVHV